MPHRAQTRQKAFQLRMHHQSPVHRGTLTCGVR
jgi:hypothetical protein